VTSECRVHADDIFESLDKLSRDLGYELVKMGEVNVDGAAVQEKLRALCEKKG
jgi:hypothetical protein